MSEVKETSGGPIGGEWTAGDRKLVLKVELRPGDTTYVPWKKLMRDASKANGSSASVPDPPPNANPNLESRLAPGQPAELETNDQPHSNRFNAVIEKKVERLYKGNDSGDGEELDSAPDDDEYDTEDSFIDDAELDECFEVDNSTVKHDGFYLNRGKLERMEPATTSNLQPKKRRRKDSAKPSGDAVDVDISDKHTKLSVTARRKDQSIASGSSLKRKYNVAKATQESPLSFGAQDANASLSLDEVKHPDRANHQSRNATSHKTKEAGSSNGLHQKYSNKSLHQQSKSLQGKSPPNVFAEATVVRQKENNGMHELANARGSKQSSQASRKDGSNVKSKTSTLEKAIRELEKVVDQSRPPAITENQEADTSSQAVTRRLPRDVKLNLAKVAKTDIFDGEALSSDGKVSGTEILGDSGVRVSTSYSHTDVKFALTHVKDHVVSVPHQDSQSKTSMSSKYELEKRKKKSNYSTQKSYPSSLPFVSDTKKDASPPIHTTKRHTWHQKFDSSSSSSSSFVAAKPLSSTLSTQQKFPKVTAQSNSSYVRKGNSLLRKPSHGSPGVALGIPPSAIQLNHFTVEDKSTGSSSMVEVDNTSSLVKAGEILTLERQSKPPSDSSTSKVSNAIATSSGKCALSYSMDHLTTGLPESIMDSATSGEAHVPHSGGDTFKTSDTLIQTGYASDCQQKRNPPNLDSLNLKKMVYVKRKANQLVAASDIHGVSTNQIPSSDGYFKRSKNQLVRNSESRVNQSISLPDDALDTRSAANMVSERSSSSAFSDSAVMRPFKQSKFSLVWMQNDPQPRMPIAHMRYQKIFPQLVPWKRVTYWKRLMNSVSAYRNGSFSKISRKLSMMRKRHTVYTRSTNGYSLRKSKVLSIGGSHLKWSKSIERDSRKANEEATLAVAAFSKKESEKHSGQKNTRTTSGNHLARKLVHGERVFRFGSLRYKMDSSRRTLQRLSDVDSPCFGSSENGKGVKRSFIPKRLVIGNEEYARVGNGNQLVRDPKKRTRVLANEKVRWSLHNVRLRLAKKKKYCQFFTKFGKCNKDDGKCPYVHDPSKIAVCTKFLNGLCANANCKLTHKVIPERMPDCSYFLQGLCNNEACPYRHVHVNRSAAICDEFLKGYCSDGDECRKKHSYICPVFEATGSCSQGSKCKLHHPKNQSKGRKRKRPNEPLQKNACGRYFGSLHNVLSESEPMIFDRRSTDSEVFGIEGLDFITLGATEYNGGGNKDPATEQSISSVSESPISIYNIIRPVALMQ